MRSAIGPIWEKLKKIVRMMQLSWIKQWKGSLIRHGHVSPSSQNQNSIVWQVDNSLPCHNREKIFGHDLSKSHLLQFIQLYHIFQRKVTTFKMNFKFLKYLKCLRLVLKFTIKEKIGTRKWPEIPKAIVFCPRKSLQGKSLWDSNNMCPMKTNSTLRIQHLGPFSSKILSHT